MTDKFSFDNIDMSMTGEGVMLTFVDTATGEQRSAIFPWRALAANFTDDLLVDTETGMTLALPFDKAEIEILSVIDNLRTLAAEVDDIFAPILYDDEENELFIEVELEDWEDTIGDTIGRA